MGSINLVETGRNFTFTTEEGNTFVGDIVGDLYSYTGMWEDEGVWFIAKR